MIQLVLENADKLIPSWEHDEERLVFHLSPVKVSRSRLLHGRMDEAGAPVTEDEALGQVALQYEGDIARQVQVILELPDELWDDLADRADALLEQASP